MKKAKKLIVLVLTCVMMTSTTVMAAPPTNFIVNCPVCNKVTNHSLAGTSGPNHYLYICTICKKHFYSF